MVPVIASRAPEGESGASPPMTCKVMQAMAIKRWQEKAINSGVIAVTGPILLPGIIVIIMHRVPVGVHRAGASFGDRPPGAA